MRKIIVIILVLIGFSAYSQTPPRTGYLVQTAKWKFVNPIWLDSGAYITKISKYGGQNRYLVYDSVKGTIGYRFVSSATTIDTTSLSNRINLRVKYTDTSSMLAKYLHSADTLKLHNQIAAKMTNPMTTLGDIIYQNSSSPSRLAGNITTSQKFLMQTGTGTVSTAPSWEIIPSSSTLITYMTNTSSDVSGLYKSLKTPDISKTTYTVNSVASGVTLIRTWITEPLSPGVTFLPQGQFDLRLNASSTGGTKSINIYSELWEANSSGVDIALIGSTSYSYNLTAVEITYLNDFVTANNYIMVGTTSRLKIKIYAFGGATGSTPNVSIYYGALANTRFSIPSSSGSTKAAGVTNSIQANDGSGNFVGYSTATVDGSGNLTANTLTSTTQTKASNQNRVAVIDSVTGAINYKYISSGTTYTGGNGIIVGGSTIYNDSTKFLSLHGYSGANGTFIGTNANKAVRIRVNSVQRLTIDSATSSDLNTFIHAGWISFLRQGHETFLGAGSGGNAFIGTNSAAPFGVMSSGVARIYVQTAGNVTIGGTTNISQLAIPVAPTASANYGLFSLSNTTTAFDGTTTGKFVGSSSGQYIAVNSVGSVAYNYISCQKNGLNRWQVDSTGKETFASTITTGGTTGNQTINKPSGTVNIAAAGTTVTVTNSLVSTSSIVVAVVRTNDATAYIKNVVPSAGSFVITLGAAATSEVSIGFIVYN